MKHTYKVIVAEDEELQLGSLIRKIHGTELGFEVVNKALNGQQALKLIEKDPPDVLITDIKMPVMTGLELIEQVNNKYPWIHIIITSGFSDFDYAKKALKFGVVDYILKPVDLNELTSTLYRLKHTLNFSHEGNEPVFNAEGDSISKEDAVFVLHEHIINNFNTEINLNKIAESIHYSPGYLTKLFIQKYSTPPNKYIINLRMQRAKLLLKNKPLMSIKQIGEEVGYAEQGYFSRIFKKITGVSPLEYRTDTGT